jgi:hypothetical protein
MSKYLSVEEAHIKTGQTCKVCNHQIKMVKDDSLPAGYFKQIKTDEVKSFVISRRIKYHDSGLCNFHLKKKQGLFETDNLYHEMKEKYCSMLRALGLPARRS